MLSATGHSTKCDCRMQQSSAPAGPRLPTGCRGPALLDQPVRHLTDSPHSCCNAAEVSVAQEGEGNANLLRPINARKDALPGDSTCRPIRFQVERKGDRQP